MSHDPRERLILFLHGKDRVRIADLPSEFQDPDLLAVCDAAGLIESGRRRHCFAGGELRLDPGWEFCSLTGPNKKPLRKTLAEAEHDPDDIALYVRLTPAGEVNASELRVNQTAESKLVELSETVERLFLQSLGVVSNAHGTILDKPNKWEALAAEATVLRDGLAVVMPQWDGCKERFANVAPTHYGLMSYVNDVVNVFWLVASTGNLETPIHAENLRDNAKSLRLQLDGLTYRCDEQELLAERDKLKQPMPENVTTATGKPQPDGDPPIEPVVLVSRDKPPIVNGKSAPKKLTKAQYNVVEALLSAGPDGLTQAALAAKSGHGGGHKVARRLAANSPWNDVIHSPDGAGRHYRIG